MNRIAELRRIVASLNRLAWSEEDERTKGVADMLDSIEGVEKLSSMILEWGDKFFAWTHKAENWFQRHFTKYEEDYLIPWRGQWEDVKSLLSELEARMKKLANAKNASEIHSVLHYIQDEDIRSYLWAFRHISKEVDEKFAPTVTDGSEYEWELSLDDFAEKVELLYNKLTDLLEKYGYY